MKTRIFHATINIAWGSILRFFCVLASVFSGAALAATAIIMAVMLNATFGLQQSNCPWAISLSLHALILSFCALIIALTVVTRHIIIRIDHLHEPDIARAERLCGQETAKSTTCQAAFLYSMVVSPMVILEVSGIFIGSVKDTLLLAEQHFGMFFILMPIVCVVLSLALYLLLGVSRKYYGAD